MKTHPNESIHPLIDFVKIGEASKALSSCSGLTKREYFAGLAVQNLQNVLLRKSGHDLLKLLSGLHKEEDAGKLIAKLACQQADDLIAELNRGQDAKHE